MLQRSDTGSNIASCVPNEQLASFEIIRSSRSSHSDPLRSFWAAWWCRRWPCEESGRSGGSWRLLRL